jgi:hypothetical protein
MKSPLVPALLFLVCFSGTSQAALRCGQYLVDIGDYEADVLQRCGPPTIQDRRYGLRGQEIRDPGNTLEFNRYDQVVIDEWIYNFGPRHLKQYLRFENNILKEIRSLGYGY